MFCSWVACWLSLAFLYSIIQLVSCTLMELSTTSLSDTIVLYEGVLTYDNSVSNGRDRVLVFPFVDGCNKAFCEQFNADVLSSSKKTTVLYNSCICKCGDGILFDSTSIRCLKNVTRNETIHDTENVGMDNLTINSSWLYINDTYNDPVTDSEDDGLEFHIWIICMSASFILCILFIYSAFEKRKQKRKPGKEQHSTLQSKYYAHEVAGVRKTLMECYNMPRIKARPEGEPKLDNEFPERSRLSSDEDFIDSLSGSRESFLHPKWESRAPSIKVTIAETTLERLNENEEEELSDHESFGKWTPAYTQQIQSKKKLATHRKGSPSESNPKTSALSKRFHSVGRRICTTSAFINLYRQKRNGVDVTKDPSSTDIDSNISAIASSIEGPITSTEPTTPSSQPSNSIDTVINFNGLNEEKSVIDHDAIISV